MTKTYPFAIVAGFLFSCASSALASDVGHASLDVKALESYANSGKPSDTTDGRPALVAGSASNAEAPSVDLWYRCQEPHGGQATLDACTAIIEAKGKPADSLGYAYVYRGNAHLDRHEADLALADFTTALKYAPPLAHAYYGLGLAFKLKEDWSHAADAFAKAAASRAPDADVDHFTFDSLGGFRDQPLVEHGYALFKEGNTDQALADFTEAARLCPTCAAPSRYASLVLTGERKFTEAAASADHAIALDPRAPGSFFFRGALRATMGQSKEAIADYSEALRLDSSFDLARQARSRAYLRAGNTSDNSPPPSTSGPSLGAAQVTEMFAGKTWHATQGPWAAEMEFRADGSFRQHSRDQTENSLEVETDGAWAVVNSQLCLYTNRRLCMDVRGQGEDVTLARLDGVIEYVGASSALRKSDTDNASSPIKEFPLREKLLAGNEPRTGKGRTLLYYIHGFEGRAPTHSPLLEYFIEQIRHAEGWDVIDADYPLDVGSNGQVMRYEAANYGAAAFVARRIKELNAQGYDRIFVGGQSWGGWTSLILSTQANVPLSGTLLIVPACCGWLNTGDPDDPELQNNMILFDQIIRRVRYPTVAVFFAGDRGETADRGANAARVLEQKGVPGLIIDHPPGFLGHGAGWFPVFDFEYRDCITAFLKAPSAAHCAPQQINGKDFRTVFTAASLGATTREKLGAKDLVGRTFAIWPDGDLRKVGLADTQVTSYALGTVNWPSSFKNGAYCLRGRVGYLQPVSTDEQCVNLVKWSDREILAIDEKSGTVLQWWTEEVP